jgi:hypothetical protein
MATRLKENPIGEHIYNRIKEYDITSRKVFLNNLTEDQRTLYNKYKNMVNKRNSLNKEDNREKANTAAQKGMEKLRATRPKEHQKEQRKPYDTKYNEKRRMTREQAATVIQKQYKAQKQNREEATAAAKDILNDILDVVPNLKLVNGELKAKRGRKIK